MIFIITELKLTNFILMWFYLNFKKGTTEKFKIILVMLNFLEIFVGDRYLNKYI